MPGAEAAVLAELPEARRTSSMRCPGGGVILVGERAAEVPGLYSAVAASPGAPAPASAGSRGGPVNAARWTPARSRPCCPAAAR